MPLNPVRASLRRPALERLPLKEACAALSLLALALAPASPAGAQVLPGQPDATVQAAQLEPAAPAEVPKPELERPTVWGEPTEVQIGMYVIDVDSVDSANQNFSASVYYESRWRIPALRHEGPGPQIRQVTAVWTPRLGIVNQQQAWSAFPPFVEIRPDGEIIYRHKTWGWFSQPLDLRDFPFDRQTLTLHIAAAGLLESEVRMVAGEREHGRRSGIASKFSLPDFKVLSWKAESRPYQPFEGQVGTAGFIMEIDIARSGAYYLWKLILPLCLIVMMSWVPRWINPKEIGTNMGIAATSFLTLVAYLFAIAVLLPKVAYFTRMDMFVLLSTLMVFVSLLQAVATSALVATVSASRLHQINVWSRVAYPVLLVTVLVYSFVW